MGYFTHLYQSGLPHRAVCVYMYLWDHKDGEGKCFPAIGTIAGELNLSKSTVKRALIDLEKAGWIRRECRKRENGGSSFNYYFYKKLGLPPGTEAGGSIIIY